MFASSVSVVLASLALVSRASADIPTPWSYGGCMNFGHFQENITPRYVDTLVSPFMSTGECLTTCATFNYAGIKGENCYCGNAPFPTLDRSLDNMCDTPCPGFPTDKCGGESQFGWVSMYSNSRINVNTTSATSIPVSTYSMATTAPVSSTTSTLYTTEIRTITSCAETVTNCPARTSTTVYSIGTTVVPCSTTADVASIASTTAVLFTSTTASRAANGTVKATSSPSPTTVLATGAGNVVAASWAMIAIAGLAACL